MRINRTRYAFLFILTLVLLAGPADAALNAYMALTDEPGGTPIMGGSTQTGREGQVEVNEFHHLMEIPGGQTTVDHQTVIVTVNSNDPSLPILLQKMDANGLLGVTVHFWEPNGVGQEVDFLDVTLTDAKLVSVETLLPDNRVPELQALTTSARLRFTYATIDFNNIGAALNHTMTNTGN